MPKRKKKRAVFHAEDFGIAGTGRDETTVFQKALDRLSRNAPAVLYLQKGAVYSVTSLQARDGVTIRGHGAVIRNLKNSVEDGVFLFRAGRGVDFALEDLTLRAACSLRARSDATIRIRKVLLKPVKEGSFESRFDFAEESRLLAEDSHAQGVSSQKHPAVFQDRARICWRGGTLHVQELRMYDEASGSMDVESLGNGTGDRHPSALILGRTSGHLWSRLCGRPGRFKRILENPAFAPAFARWKAHNTTQDGRLTLRIRKSPPATERSGAVVRTFGSYRLTILDSPVFFLVANDQSRITMRGGSLTRLEAYGLSRSAFTDVRVVMPGSDDPWHPKTTYMQGNHCMEFSRMYNDLLPRVEFTGGVIDFAGDDCLNGLPESRAIQLMEIVHDPAGLFPGFSALEKFEPENREPGCAVTEITGSAGAVHNEDTTPVLPYDFRKSAFRWKGEYAPDQVNHVGDIHSWNGLLYVCNRKNKGVEPKPSFDHWQVFTVGFRNADGYIQAARRVFRDRAWTWEKRQALGPWAGYMLRERGNPVVTYQVHFILRNTEIIRRANTWSFSEPNIPVGNAGYDYVLSTLVANVPFNHDCNIVECYHVTIRNVGTDAMPIRGLSIGPNPNRPARYVFDNVHICGESIGAPLCFRIPPESPRRGNRVVLRNITAAYNPGFRGAMQPVVEKDPFVQYEFLAGQPREWQGTRDYLSRFIDVRKSAEFVRKHPGIVCRPEPLSGTSKGRCRRKEKS